MSGKRPDTQGEFFTSHVTLRSVDVVVGLRNRCHMGEKHR